MQFPIGSLTFKSIVLYSFWLPGALPLEPTGGLTAPTRPPAGDGISLYNIDSQTFAPEKKFIYETLMPIYGNARLEFSDRFNRNI